MINLKGLSSFGIEAVKRLPKPQISRVLVDVTNKCNAKCTMCGIWESKEPKTEWTFGDFFYLLNANNIMWIDLTGGEPSLTSDFHSFLRLAALQCKLVHFATNGILTDNIIQAVKYALNTDSSSLIVPNISIHGNAEIHNWISGVSNSYIRIIQTIEELRAINSSRLRPGLHFTFCRYNEDKYEHVKQLAKFYHLGLTYSWERHSNFYNNKDYPEEYKPKLPAPEFSANPINIFANLLLMNSKHQSGCVAGEYSCCLDHNYNVYPCFFSIGETKPLFNLKKGDFRIKPAYFENYLRHKNGCRCLIACETYQTLIWRPWRCF